MKFSFRFSDLAKPRILQQQNDKRKTSYIYTATLTPKEATFTSNSFYTNTSSIDHKSAPKGTMSEDSSGSNPFTYIIIPLVAILSIGFIATVLYCRRRRHGRDGSDNNNTSSALDYPYPDWTQDRFMAAEGNLLHYPGGRHLSAFTASASAANSIEAARRANAIRYNHNTIGFGGFGRPARHAHLNNNNNNSTSNNDNDRSGPRTITIPQWSFWGGMRSTEGLNELGEAPPPYDTKRKTRSGSNNNLESEAERGNAGIDGGDGAADGDDDNNNNGGGGGGNNDDANRQYGMEFSTRRGRRRRRRNDNNNDQEENNSQSRSRSRTPCRCRSQTRESFESAIALQDWLIPRVTDMNAGAMPPEYVARPEPVITAGPRGQPDFPAGSGPSRL